MTLSDVSGIPATQRIFDSMHVCDASEASLDDLLLSENEEAMDNDPASDGDNPHLDNQE